MNNKTELKKILKLKKIILKNQKCYINNDEILIADIYINNFFWGPSKFNIYLNIKLNKILLYRRWTDELYGEINYNNYKKLIKLFN